MSTLFTILSAVLAVVGTVLIFIFILPGDKRAGLPKFGKWIHDFLNFKNLVVEAVLKFLYILCTLFVVLDGFFTIFTENYMGQSNALQGLLTMVFGPITVRLAFELLMLLILLVKNVMAINRRLSGEDGTVTEMEFLPGLRALLKTEPDVVNEVPVDISCPHCGSMATPEQAFCCSCGQKLIETETATETEPESAE